MAAPFETWVIRPKHNFYAKMRLLFFSYSGSGASLFNAWSGKLPADVELCLIELPGRESRFRETPYDRLDPLLQELATVLKENGDLPFALFGHCMGALICFELARLLRKTGGLQPLHIFVSGHCAPQCMNVQQQSHTLSDPEFIEELRRLEGTSENLLNNALLMELLLPTLRADFALSETYRFYEEEPLPSSISAFGGMQDTRVSAEELCAWKNQTSAHFLLHMLPGQHFFLLNARDALLEIISRELRQILTQKGL